MDPSDEEFYEATRARIQYIQNLMAYIACEWDGVPETVLPAHAIFLNKCCDNNMLLPNAAGLFAEQFLKNGVNK
jgi:hypothetical protein